MPSNAFRLWAYLTIACEFFLYCQGIFPINDSFCEIRDKVIFVTLILIIKRFLYWVDHVGKELNIKYCLTCKINFIKLLFV